MLKKWNH